MPGKKSRILFIAAFGLLLGLMTIAAPAFAASKEKVLYSFCAAQLCPDGANPMASLISDASGDLYGTALYGGNSNCPHGCGTVFELMRANGKWKQKVLHHFHDDGNDGFYPEASLIFDAAGNLYGTTSAGGADQVGTVFELMLQKNGKWKEKILHSFASTSADGWEPVAALVFDTKGSLYGATFYGGAYDYGTVFELTPGAKGHWSEKVLHDFNYGWNSLHDYFPAAVLIFDSSGNLYGTTSGGGWGTVFEMTPGKHGNWKEKVLYSFSGGSDGGLPGGGLIFGADGSLYDTAAFGGAYSDGTLFKLTPGAKGEWTLTTLYSFDETDGAFPNGVIFDAAGNLDGTTSDGGAYKSSGCDWAGCGTVFKMTPGQWTETVLHSFNNDGVDGFNPYSSVIMDAAGNLYGTTYSGGAYNYGTVFEVTP